MSDSDNASHPPVPSVNVEGTDADTQDDQSDVNAASQTESIDKTPRPRLRRSYSKGLNTPSDGRKFHTIHSSDGAKFFNLENQLRELQGSNKGDGYPHPGSERQLTVETAIYRDQPMFTDSRRPLLPSEMRSVRSGTESTRSTKRKKRPGINTAVTPAQIFAQNLSDAVLDADDSDEHESFVYRDKTISSTKSFNPNLTWSSFEATSNDPFQPPSVKGSSNYVFARASDSDLFREQKLRDDHESHRPALRSSVSDLPYHFGRQRNFGQSEWYPSDEETAPLIRNSYSRKRKQADNNTRRMAISIASLCLMMVAFAILLLVVASPLDDVQVSSIGNVLSTQKELIFDVHVQAANHNWWTIKMVHADISIFASSHFVPLGLQPTNATNHINEQVADPAEFLGSIYHFDEPLVFQPAGLFESKISISTSQVQIKQPGNSEDDNSGNERWSRLIRYPYELTVRGVLKYRIFPFFSVSRVHTARVCNVSSVDPATGKVTDAPPIDKAICKTTSPKPKPTNDTTTSV
ncbi:hypothetical protein K450DRAFT_254383 [Umbelopsis ramanniana AG]|uniref:Vacuolar segregation protein 7 n=1 Tax=Umbelopsis ramanniana AG TaxID=1314678 RepID=A0AAD5E5D4_UMBRA|nr:uncharacterized protein K450DRAFT_254383 [Umbelopsis ramanniana AG]KAI8576949.1 hypothetical protein K450DRAFT_254383 [Umbelopsis ramanniana AG]